MKIRNKILLFVTPLAVLMTGSVWIFSGKAVRSVIIQETIRQKQTQAEDIARDATSGFESGSEVILLASLKTYPLEEGSYGLGMDQNGTILAHTDILKKGQTLSDPSTLRALKSDESIVEIAEENKKMFLNVFVPVWDVSAADENEFLFSSENDHPKSRVRLGTIRFSHPLEASFQVANIIAQRISLIIFICSSIMFFFLLFFLKQISQPISMLREATRKIAGGEYGATVDVLTKDELGELAESFNRMSGELSRTTVSKDFLSSVMGCMSDALLVWNMEGSVQMANQAALHLLGYGEEELIGTPCEKLFEGENGLFVSMSVSFQQISNLKNAEIALRSKAQVSIPVLASATPLIGADGKAKGVVLIAKDISDRKKMERRLAQSEKMSAVGQLAAGVAHEINNPLGIILGFAQGMVRRLIPNDPNDLPIKTIEREAIRCKNLVQDLLTFSRASKTDREPLDLHKCIMTSVALIQTQARLNQVEVKCELAESLPHVLGNSNQIEQVIVNMASNAYDAMPKGGTLTIKTELMAGTPQSWVCLRISDNGTGIPKEIQSRIFEPFFTTKPVGKGTGLGLGMVYEIVKKHSGMIDLESRPGFTEFTVRFPVRASTQEKQTVQP